jgi:hypothetical protein
MSRWFRHYAGMMRDDKLVRVAIRSKQTIERVQWVWGAILESAAEIDDNGRYDVDAAEVAYFLRADEGDISAILGSLSEAGRVADGSVVHWGDRQFSSDRSKDRVAAHRERKRAENRGDRVTSEDGNGVVTLHKRHCNSPETETELDTEKKKTPLPPKGADLPDWIPADEWAGYERMRKTIRKPLTIDARKLAFSELAKLRAAGNEPAEVLNQSILNSWQGLFEVKARARASPQPVVGL